jgi:hypothetical protein
VFRGWAVWDCAAATLPAVKASATQSKCKLKSRAQYTRWEERAHLIFQWWVSSLANKV